MSQPDRKGPTWVIKSALKFDHISTGGILLNQKYPEKHQDLIVRVAGYSDYFNDLGEDLQNEIIRRTKHSEF